MLIFFLLFKEKNALSFFLHHFFRLVATESENVFFENQSFQKFGLTLMVINCMVTRVCGNAHH